jgi:hypothetical protein
MLVVIQFAGDVPVFQCAVAAYLAVVQCRSLVVWLNQRLLLLLLLLLLQVISDDTLAGFKKRNASEGEGSLSDGGPDNRPHYLRPTSAGAGRVASPVNGRSNRCERWHAQSFTT